MAASGADSRAVYHFAEVRQETCFLPATVLARYTAWIVCLWALLGNHAGSQRAANFPAGAQSYRLCTAAGQRHCKLAAPCNGRRSPSTARQSCRPSKAAPIDIDWRRVLVWLSRHSNTVSQLSIPHREQHACPAHIGTALLMTQAAPLQRLTAHAPTAGVLGSSMATLAALTGLTHLELSGFAHGSAEDLPWAVSRLPSLHTLIATGGAAGVTLCHSPSD